MAQKKTSRKRTTTAKATPQEAPKALKAPASTGDAPDAPKVKKATAAKKVAPKKAATKKAAAPKAAMKQAEVKPRTDAHKTPAEAPSKKAAAKAPARKAAAPVVETPASAAATAPAPAEPVPAPTTVPAPARKTAARKFPAKTVTTIVAQVDVGWGNNLYIRGEGAGLSWEHGKLMDWTDGAWTWTTTQATGPIAFKFLKNDEIWSPGDNLTVEPGGTSITSPEL